MSTLSVGQVRRLRVEALGETARALDGDRARVVGVIASVMWRRATRMSWTGAAADAAGERYTALTARLVQLAGRLGASAQAVRRAAPRLRSAVELAQRAQRRAEEGGADLDEAGLVVRPPRPAEPDPVMAAHRSRQDLLLDMEVAQLVRWCTSTARAADDDLASQLAQAATGHLTALALTHGTIPPPPTTGHQPQSWDPAADAFAGAAWWRALTPAERREVTRDHPEWVGPRDGIPAADRHAANLVLLARLENEAGARLATAVAESRWWRDTGVEQAQERVDDLAALRQVLARTDGGPRTLLLVDGSGALLKSATAVGEVDTATHIVTFVGGMTTTVRGDLARYDARFREMRDEGATMALGDLAIITWLGYEAPQGDEVLSVTRSVALRTVARQSAADLARFVSGVAASRSRPVHQTVWAHSYGTVLTGFALLRPMPVSDVVVFGAPGLAFSRMSLTGLKPGGLNVIRAQGDLVASLGPRLLGTQAVEVVGARWLSSSFVKGTPNDLTASSEHSHYLDRGTTSARNLLAVAMGRADLVIEAPSSERALHPSWADLAPIMTWPTAAGVGSSVGPVPWRRRPALPTQGGSGSW